MRGNHIALLESGKSTHSCDCHNHCFVRWTRVTYAVFIVKAGKVGAEMQGLARRIPGITLKHQVARVRSRFGELGELCSQRVVALRRNAGRTRPAGDHRRPAPRCHPYRSQRSEGRLNSHRIARGPATWPTAAVALRYRSSLRRSTRDCKAIGGLICSTSTEESNISNRRKLR